jgi:hypothetical protein
MSDGNAGTEVKTRMLNAELEAFGSTQASCVS